MFGKLILWLCPLLATSTRIKIGRISRTGDDVRLSTEEFWSYNSNSVLEPVTHRLHWWNTLDVAIGVCKLAEQNVKALVFDGPPRLRSLMSTYSEHMQVPSVGGVVNVVPDTSEAAAKLITQWKSFAFIYQTDAGADQLNRILRHLDYCPLIEAFWRTNGAKETLEFIRNLQNTPLVLACSRSLVDELLSILPAIRRSYDIMLLTPVGSITRKFHPGSYRLIQFSYMDLESPNLKGFENRWNTIRGISKQEQDISDSAILNYEASKVLQTYFSKETSSFPDYPQRVVDCFNYTAGFSTQALKEVSISESLTGNVNFDIDGNRKEKMLNIYEEKPFDLKKIGSWSSDKGMQLLQSHRQVAPVSAAYQQSNPVRVTSILVKPYLFEGESGDLEGYVVDFLEELMAIIQLPYQLQLVKDGSYGFEKNGVWVGMIGELIRGEADMAVSPLTKTKEREKVVDFSKIFMTFGLNLLLKKPDALQHENTSLDPFSFLTIWPVELWVVIIVIVIIMGAACYAVSRYIGPPDRVRALESKGTDNLSPCGSFWFTIASLVQRDTGIYPRTFSHRTWACLWWALCFFLAIGYISYLNATLLQTRQKIVTTHTRKTSHEVIQDLLEKGSPNIGTIARGSTYSFFLNSTVGAYYKVGQYLQNNPDMMMRSYEEADKKIRESNGTYAFIMESPSSQFYANTPPCDTFVTSGYLTTKAFAVALPKNSSYKNLVDHGVLVMQETGTLRRLYEKWWHAYSTDTSCEDPNMDILPKVYNRSLMLREVSGAFYILILFTALSIGMAFIEKKFIPAKQMVLD